MGKLDGKVAVITGANAGIGKVTAELFAKEGATIVLVARRAEKLKEVEDGIVAAGGKALSVPADVSKLEDITRIFDSAIAAYGKVDILVNNAGVSDSLTPTTKVTDELWNRNISINQDAVFFMCKEALKYMEAVNSGNIINVSSIGGVYSIAGASYSASKMAVLGLTKHLGIQFAGTGIRCNCVCPGGTDTDMMSNMTGVDEHMKVQTGKYSDGSFPGMLEPMDIANAILFFASEDSRYINGQRLVIDRGRCL